MNFTPDTFVDGIAGNTPITAAKLNNLEQGVVNDDGTNPASAEAQHDAATFVPYWAPNTFYAAGKTVVAPSGDLVTATTAHTSGTTFSGTGTGGNWKASGTFSLAIFASDYGLSVSATPSANVTALQNAVAAAGAKGWPLVIGAGIFHVNAQITVDQSIRIVGAGRYLTTLHQDQRATAIFYVTAPNVTIHEMCFDGQGLDATGLPLYGAGSFRGHVGVWTSAAASNLDVHSVRVSNLGIGVALENPCPNADGSQIYATQLVNPRVYDIECANVWCGVEGNYMTGHYIHDIRGSYAQFTGTPSSGDTSSPAHLVYISGDATHINGLGSFGNIAGYGTTAYSTPLKLKYSVGGSAQVVTGNGTMGLVEMDSVTDFELVGFQSVGDILPAAYAGASIWLTNCTKIRIINPSIAFANGPHGEAILANSGSTDIKIFRPRVTANLSADNVSLNLINLLASDVEVTDARIDSIGATAGAGIYLAGTTGVVDRAVGTGAMNVVVNAGGGRQAISYDSYISLPPRKGTTATQVVLLQSAAVTGKSYVRDLSIGQSIPTGLTDSFDRANTSTLGYTDDMKPWISRGLEGIGFGSFIIEGNAARYNGGSARSIATAEAAMSDGTLTGVIDTLPGANAEGFAVRVQDANNYIAVIPFTGGNIQLVKRVAGTSTVVATSTNAVSASDTFAIVLAGTSVSVKQNGTQIIAPQTITDFSTVTRHGLLGASAGKVFKAASLSFA